MAAAKKPAPKKAADPKPAHVDAAKDKAAAVQHDAQVKRTGEAAAAKKVEKTEFKELVSRDERHDSIDPNTGTLTAEAVALRAQHGIDHAGEQAPKQNVQVDVGDGDAVRQPGGAMVTVQPGQSAAAPPIDQPVTAGVVNTTGSMGFADKEEGAT